MINYIPILGHIKKNQKKKGLILGGAFYALLITTIISCFNVFPKVFNQTIGYVAGLDADNSLYILIQFGYLIALIGVVIFIYILIVKDAKRMSKDMSREEQIRDFKDNMFVIGMLIPAFFLVMSFVVIPILLTVLISFTNYSNLYQPPFNLISWEGLQNYKDFLIPSVDSMNYSGVFFQVLSWTVIWTLIATTGQIILGTIVALVFNQSDLKFKKYFMPLFLLTWAIPTFITIGMFSLMFADSTGVINSQLLPLLNNLLDPFIVNGDLYTILEKIAEIGMSVDQKNAFEITTNTYGVMEVPWKTNVNLTKFAILLIQPLLGFPYVFTLVLGSLKSIPDSLYNAADMDGANDWQKMKKITIPLVVISTLPVLITQYTFNFNNFGMIYLFNGGGPGSIGAGAGSTDILMSWVFKIMTGSTPDYGLAAAVSLIMSVFTVAVSLTVFLKSNAFNNEDMR